MAQRYADYLEREAHHAATPVRAEAIRQVANKLRELERENAALAAERDSALERLTCWLIEMPATSEWPAIWLAITTDSRRWFFDGGTLYATGCNWYFTTAAIEALKFADEESANSYVRHNKIKDAVVTEHIFAEFPPRPHHAGQRRQGKMMNADIAQMRQAMPTHNA